MCLLILIQGLDPEYPLLVASNRDEERSRKASPPGLFMGVRQRLLSPRDRRSGGTWLALNRRGMFAGITNIAGAVRRPLATTRGALPHLALDQDDLDAAASAVRAAVAAADYNAFQLLISGGGRTRILCHRDGRLDEQDTDDTVVVVSNEHQLGQLVLPGVDRALAHGLSATKRLDLLRLLLLDEGGISGHRILKKNGDHGTVSSSLIAVPRSDITRLIWLYAPGPPDEHDYRSYGNLARRLVTT
jgi:hypothetical protein